MIAKVQKWGNSQGLRFPKTVLAEARIDVGDPVSISVQKGQIIVKPVRKVRGKYTLKELVARIPKGYKPAELDWGSPAGKEVW